jgi:hypothetical protein
MTALKALPRLRLLYANLVPFDPLYRAKLADSKRLLPQVTIIPVGERSAVGGMGGHGGF